jgi:hypothetical protein
LLLWGCGDDTDPCAGGKCAIPPGVPDDPVCYTPCTQGFQDADGIYHRCDADGLMRGCFGDSVCVQGSCVPDASAETEQALTTLIDDNADAGPTCTGGHCDDQVPTCATDNDCPEYQTCIAAQCYSNCETDEDCTSIAGCYKKVCRTKCETGADKCGKEAYCELDGSGNAGFCMPTASTSPPPDVDGGPFWVEVESLRFSPTQTDAKLLVVNRAQVSQKITISRSLVTFYDGSGEATGRAEDKTCSPGNADESTCPLTWLTLSADGTNATGSDDLAHVPRRRSAVALLQRRGPRQHPLGHELVQRDGQRGRGDDHQGIFLGERTEDRLPPR